MTFGPDNATLTVHTKRGGAAAKAGHDLTLLVERWNATYDEGDLALEADGLARDQAAAAGQGGVELLGATGQEVHEVSSSRATAVVRLNDATAEQVTGHSAEPPVRTIQWPVRTRPVTAPPPRGAGGPGCARRGTAAP